MLFRSRRWERDGGSWSDAAILYRGNAQSRAFEEELSREGIAYRVYGGVRFFERAEIKDTLAYLRLVANRSDDAAFERAINTPARGIGGRTLDELRRHARLSTIPLWEAAVVLSGPGGLAGRARNAVRGFLELVEALAAELREMDLAQQVDHVLARDRKSVV